MPLAERNTVRRIADLTPMSERFSAGEVAQIWFRWGREKASEIHVIHPNFPKPGPDGLYLREQVREWFDLVRPSVGDPSSDMRDMGYVYFIQATATKRIKIGWSKDPHKRLIALQISCPDELVLLGTLLSVRDDESDLHALFAKCWVRGEWFEPAPELLAYIEEEASN